MLKNYKISERQTVPNVGLQFSLNQFTKSLTSFHPKTVNSKNITQHTTIKKHGFLNQNHKKFSKTKRIFFSNHKKKDLGYLMTNPVSPNNNNKYKEMLIHNPLKTTKMPSSDQRLYKYKNGYILNIINNYKPNIIIDIKSKTNKYDLSNDKKLNDENKKNDNNDLSNNDIENNGRKTYGGPNNFNTSLIHSENCLNTIAITLTNNNYNNENRKHLNYIKFNGLKGLRLDYLNNKSIRHFNDFTSFNSRNKMLKKLSQKKKKISKKKKEINLLKSKNINNIKKSGLIKTKSKLKMKSNYNAYSTSNINLKNKKNKKKNKSSTNIANSIITNANTNTNINKQSENENNEINRNIQKDDDNYKNKNPGSNNNLYNFTNNNDLFYETVDSNALNDDFIGQLNIFNIINSNNQRNKDYYKDFNTLKSLNSIKSFQQSINTSNNGNNDNSNINNNNNINIIEYKEKNDLSYQTFSGPFRKKLIKVNIIEKEDNKKTENMNDDKKLCKNQKGAKSANNLKTNINTSNKKKEQKSLYIDTEIQRDNKNNKSNKKKFKNDQIKNKAKTKNNNLTDNKKNKKIEIGNYNFIYNKTIENSNKNNDLSNFLFNSLLYLKNNCKKSEPNSNTNSLNYNAYPLTRDSSHTFIKKKSSVTNINKSNKDKKHINKKHTNKKHTKNKSISSISSCGIQRLNKGSKLNIKNEKKYLYSAQSNRIKINAKNTSVIVPEYTIKLENIKSRISNLLNIYSLLALRTINNISNNSEK